MASTHRSGSGSGSSPGELPRIHLIRHAHAGSRADWSGDDAARPLSPKGEAQVAALTDALLGAGIDDIRSSPFVRCRRTVEPLAVKLGVAVASDHRLAEGADGAAALDALVAAAMAGRTVAACSHGDVIPALVAEAVRRGADLDGPPELRKGARYVLTVRRGGVAHIGHVPRPEG